MDAKTLNVICFTVAQGHVHDFRIFKECGVYIPERIQAILDSGYTGIDKIHKNSLVPRKSSKNHPLTDEDKAYNHEISRQRIRIEHVNRYLKRFRILSSRYRNKRNRFAFRVSLICGIFNALH